jgi:hypothetical protein
MTKLTKRPRPVTDSSLSRQRLNTGFGDIPTRGCLETAFLQERLRNLEILSGTEPNTIEFAVNISIKIESVG